MPRLLPAHPDLGRRREANELLGAAQRGDDAAVERIRAVSDRPILG